MDALLLIDFPKDFLMKDGRMPINPERAEHLITVANELINHFKKNGRIVVFVGNEFSKTDFIPNLLRRGAALKGSDDAELDPRINKENSPYFTKSESDAFSNPDLDTYLKRHGVSRVYMGGVNSEGCIRATAVGAMKKGYQVPLIADAVSSNWRFKRNFALWYLCKHGGNPCS